ncbi:hypothetical protein RHSIM_Rhsim02G0063900 [Rhododendron simsii]|uniref:Protein kinase domain-containing protein n=1 Tax=Rhododendron simsii TaxID=118357 RepID=A0A834HEW4_RHOSS|nr:hypothetical protein RHSIM_Rhsim02G0063900 [Rhododendron simsii]
MTTETMKESGKTSTAIVTPVPTVVSVNHSKKRRYDGNCFVCDKHGHKVVDCRNEQVLCGRPTIDERLEEQKSSLILWAKMYVKKGKIDRIVDPSLNGEISPRIVKYFAELANKCLHIQSKERPTMAEVVQSLEIALVSHERKGRSHGNIAKAFQGIKLGPKDLQFRNPFDQAGATSSTDSLSLKSWEIALDGGVDQFCPFIPLSEILKATNDFDEALVIGTGGFGKVYKAIIDDGATTTVAAIKRLNAESNQEYFLTKRLTKKSDVYAFGVVLLEVLCGRQPIDTRLEEEQISLIRWAQMYIKKGKIERIIDPSLNGEATPQSLKYFAELANKCLHTQPKERPTMAEVVESLDIALVSHERKGRLQGTTSKAFWGIKIVPKEEEVVAGTEKDLEGN